MFILKIAIRVRRKPNRKFTSKFSDGVLCFFLAAPGEGISVALDSHGGAPPPPSQGKAGFVKNIVQNGPFRKIKAPSQATYFRMDTPSATPRPAEQASSSTDVAAALEASLRAERDAIADGEKKLAEAMMHGSLSI